MKQIETPSAPSDSPGATDAGVWQLRRGSLLGVAGLVLGLFLLVGVASAIDFDSLSAPAEVTSADRNTEGDARDYFDPSIGGEQIRPIPGCPGGFSIGEDILVVPDPEACGFRALPPGVGSDSGKIMLVPSPNGDVGGVRIGPDGRIELVDPNAVSPGDIVIGTLPDGSFRLQRPDGSMFDVAPGDDGLSFRDRAGNSWFVPNPGADSSNTPNRPTQVDPPAFDPDPPRSAPRGSEPRSSGDSVALWLLVGLAAAAAIAGALWLWRGRVEQDGDDDTTAEMAFAEAEEPPVDFSAEISAIDRMLWEIDQAADPRTAIRRVYGALETGLNNPAMARRRSETPHVYLQRVLGSFDALRPPLARLTHLFEQARFSEHEITPQMRDEAVFCLNQIRAYYATHSMDDQQLAGSVS